MFRALKAALHPKLLVAFIAGVLLLPSSDAPARFPRGTPSLGNSIGNQSRVTLNINPSNPYLINLAKTFAWNGLSQTNCASAPCLDSNGYPNSTPSSNIGSNPSLPSGYYGTYTMSWSGSAAFKDVGAPPVIYNSISPSGAVIGVAGTSGDQNPGDHAYVGASNTTVANLSLQFQYGWNIQSISNNGSGLIRVNTKTNYVASCSGYSIQTGTDTNGNTGPLVNITGAVANTNANGTWAITNCTASSFDLVGSTFANAQAAAQGTAVFAAKNLAYYFLAQGTWSGFSNFVLARTGDVSVIAAGHHWDTTYVSQLQAAMNPNGTCAANRSCGWLRFMDFIGAQFNFEKDYSQRIPVAAFSYAPKQWWPAGHWSGQITNTSDALVATNPSASPSTGGYVDGEVVQGYVSATNTTRTPTLRVNRTGAVAKPIFAQDTYNAAPFTIYISGQPTAGQIGSIMQFTFSVAGNPSWFNGGAGSITVPYTIQSSDVAANGGSFCDFTSHIASAISANAALASSGVLAGNPLCATGPVVWQPVAQAGRMSISYSSGPALVTGIGAMPPSNIVASSSTPVTFVYSYLLDGWIYINQNFVFSPPMEVAADLANQVGANVWWHFTLNSSSYITSVVQNFASNLNSGLKFGFENANEVWNVFGPQPGPLYRTLGATFGIGSSSNNDIFSFTSLRTIQQNAVAQPAWTGAGRLANDFYTFIMAQADGENVNGNFDTYQLKSASIGTSNTWIANYGALGGGTVSTNYAAAGNRAVDCNTYLGIGIAPYWGSPWFGWVATDINGTTTVNAPWLTAQLHYAQGLTATAFSEITNTFNGTTARSDGGNAGQLMLNAGSAGQNIYTMYQNMEAIAAQYDSGRARKIARFDYEGAPQWGFGNNGNSGTNSASDSTSLTELANRFTALGWNVSAYTISGTDSKSELAQQLLTFTQAWKNSSSYSNLIVNSLYQPLATISSSREVHPAQYGYDANIWGLFPGDYHVGNNYSNFNAIATQNAGN